MMSFFNKTRVLRCITVTAFAVGVFAILSVDGIEAANKQADAKRYLEQLKTTTDAKKKVEALEELGKLGQIMASLAEPAIPYMAKALEDKEPTVREAAAYAYGRSNPDPKDAVPALVKLLKNDKEEKVKLAAASGLAAMGSSAKDAIPALKEIVKNEDKKSKLAKSAGQAMKSINAKNK